MTLLTTSQWAMSPFKDQRPEFIHGVIAHEVQSPDSQPGRRFNVFFSIVDEQALLGVNSEPRDTDEIDARVWFGDPNLAGDDGHIKPGFERAFRTNARHHFRDTVREKGRASAFCSKRSYEVPNLLSILRPRLNVAGSAA